MRDRIMGQADLMEYRDAGCHLLRKDGPSCGQRKVARCGRFVCGRLGRTTPAAAFSRRALPTTLVEGGCPRLGVLAVLRLSCHTAFVVTFYVLVARTIAPHSQHGSGEGWELMRSRVRLRALTEVLA